MADPLTGSIERCVADASRLIQEHWAQKPFYQRGATSIAFDSLLTIGDVDRLLATVLLTHPDLLLVKSGVVINPETYTNPSDSSSEAGARIADAGRVYAQFSDGATIVLNGIQRFLPPLGQFCSRLGLVLTAPVQANLYVSPPLARGFAIHDDSHDVLVLQVSGCKRWTVYEPSSPGGNDSAEVPERVLLAAALQPGDCLYIPKGYPHVAETTELASIHITVGIVSLAWLDVVHALLERAASEMEILQLLPLGFAASDALVGDVATRLTGLSHWFAKADAQEVAAWIRRTSWWPGRPSFEGHLLQLMDLDSIDGRSVFRRRPEASCEMHVEDGRLVLQLPDRKLELPSWLEAAMNVVIASGSLRLRDLAGCLDDESQRVLLRRLVREGLLEVVSVEDQPANQATSADGVW
jgi:lysine-specific demethylase/histidyl-hydroxylase NO66